MMEFTLSRTVLIVCGAILMAAVAVPISDIYGAETSDSAGGVAENAASVIDAFLCADVDELFLDGASLLPSVGYSLIVDGHCVTAVGPSGDEHDAFIQCPVEGFVLGYGDKHIIQKYGAAAAGEEGLSERSGSGTSEFYRSDDVVKTDGEGKDPSPVSIIVSCGGL